MADILADESKKDLTYDVTVKHSFNENIWTTLILPFSVSEKELRAELGDTVDVLHFTKWDPSSHTIHLTRHYWNQMIVAGTPVLIYPKKTLSEVTFHNVHIEKSAVEDVVDDSLGVIRMTGNLDKGDNVKQYDRYISTSGNFSQRTKTGNMSLKGMRGWLTGFTEASLAKTSLGFISDEESGTVDGIIKVSVDDEGNISGENLQDGIVYNLSGQIVTRDASRLNSLPQGVYILNGKKYVVQ